MENKTVLARDTQFGKEVHEGLTAFPKHLSSKYFYDETGDKLFQDIMAMPAYYLTESEYAILEKYGAEIAQRFVAEGQPFSLFELGAGDGKKTKILLRQLVENKVDFDYRPIDISQNALDQLETSIKAELPAVNVNPLQGTYFDTLKDIGQENGRRKIILFLGSNIGNLLHPQAIDFLQQMTAVLGENDLLFMGMDQKKHPQAILNAYNDKEGITAAFNKNILKRINTEFQGDFDLDKFIHWEVYDPENGTAKSYLVATEKQLITIKALDLKISFSKWETIHTEISQKYDDPTVEWLAGKAGLRILTSFADENHFFKDYILKKQLQ
ncbi:MAG: L-histidine N(alpha)-methyltransferase [Bacteroidota bacterium]